MSKARTGDAAVTDRLVLAVADLVEEVERLQAELAESNRFLSMWESDPEGMKDY
jgi:hypothetical protein